jgi:hypothetical protein
LIYKGYVQKNLYEPSLYAFLYLYIRILSRLRIPAFSIFLIASLLLVRDSCQGSD